MLVWQRVGLGEWLASIVLVCPILSGTMDSRSGCLAGTGTGRGDRRKMVNEAFAVTFSRGCRGERITLCLWVSFALE